MIELLLLLFVLQGNTPTEWIDSCSDFDVKLDDFTVENQYDPTQQSSRDIVFCKVILDLNLDEHDVEKLGRNLDWSNYANQTSIEYMNNWVFYQKYGIKDTLEIKSSVSERDSLPPPMSVKISFDFNGDETILKFDKKFDIKTGPKKLYMCNDKMAADFDCINRIEQFSCSPELSISFNLHDKSVCVKDSSLMKLFSRGYLPL